MKDLGPLWHALAGLGISAGAVALGIPGLLVLGSIALAGWLREVWQHDLRLTVWQWIEALAWSAGAAAGWALVEAFA